jgi:hypothetical protein
MHYEHSLSVEVSTCLPHAHGDTLGGLCVRAGERVKNDDFCGLIVCCLRKLAENRKWRRACNAYLFQVMGR